MMRCHLFSGQSASGTGYCRICVSADKSSESGCLSGATAAAATVTVAATVTDYQSGHVRTADEFASQLAAGTALGAVTGATLYGLWYGIPGASILMGADLAGLFASSSPVAAVAFSKAAALVSYFLMGSQVI